MTETLEVVPRRWKVIQNPPGTVLVPAMQAVLSLARSKVGATRAASGRLRRHSAGRCVRRLQPALTSRPEARSDRRGAVLEPCAPEVFRTCRHRRQCAAGQDKSDADLADRIRGPSSNASTRRSTSSARSTACRPPVAWLCAKRGALPWSRRWKPGCAPSAPNSPGTMQSPRRSTTCSRVSRPSLAFLTMAGSASRRMMLRRGNPQPGAAALAGALGGFSFHATTIRS